MPVLTPGRLNYAQIVNENIHREIEDRLQGDDTVAEEQAMQGIGGPGVSNRDQRILPANNPNFYFVRKQDFDAPNMYNLNLIKMYPRSRVRTFLPNGIIKDVND